MAVWPGVLDRLKRSNVRNYSIFLRDGVLFSYLEYAGTDYDADMHAIRDDPESQRWWTFTDPCQQPVASAPQFLGIAAGAGADVIAGVVGWVDLTAPDVADRLAALRALPGGERLVGLRHLVQAEDDPAWLNRPEVRRGVAMNHVEPLRRFVAETDVDVVMVAGRWTLVDRTAAPLLAEARARGVAVLAAAPFNAGLLARPDVPADARLDYAVAPPGLVRRLREVARALAEHGVSLPQAALQFPRRDPAVSAVAVGIVDAEQAGRNAANFAGSLAPEAWDVVDALLEEVIRR